MATGAAPSTPGTDGSSATSAPLAEAEASEQIRFKGENATLRTVVSVQRCPNGFRSRLGYHANLFLTPSSGGEREIGYITAWRLAKPTAVNRNIDASYLAADWQPPINRFDDSPKEMAYCIKAVMGRNSQVAEDRRSVFTDTGHEIVFIQMLYIKWRENPDDPQTGYSGNGLASMFLQSFYRLLGSHVLPVWFCLRGPVTYLLIPAMPAESPEMDCWWSMQQSWGVSDADLDLRVEQHLIDVYTRPRYGYERYVTGARVGQVAITVLGRTINPEDCVSIPGDRLLLRRVAQEFDSSGLHSSPSPLRHRSSSSQ